MKLSTYLAERGISDKDFGASIGRERSVVSKYRSGSVRPTLDTIQAIERATGGLVTYHDFVEPLERAAS